MSLYWTIKETFLILLRVLFGSLKGNSLACLRINSLEYSEDVILLR